jgi:CheY-like chemotaxis protein
MVPQSLLQPLTARILVVEDEILIRAFTAEELRLAGFSVIEAGHAEEALHILTPASKWTWYSQISGCRDRSTDCSWLKYFVIGIQTFSLFSRQEMPTQSTSEYFGHLFPSHTTSRKQSHSCQRC